MLEECHATARLRLLVAMLREECDLLSIEQEIEQKVQSQMEDNQRDYYLREQLKAIAGELGEGTRKRRRRSIERKSRRCLSGRTRAKSCLRKPIAYLECRPAPTRRQWYAAT